MRKGSRIAVVLLVVTILSITQAKVLAQGDSSYLEDTSSIEYLKAKVIGVEDMVEQVDGSYDYTIESQLVEAEITQGQHQGTIIKTISYKSGNPGYDLDIEPGDRVILWAEVSEDMIVDASVFSFDRSSYLKWLVVAFMAMLLLIGGVTGLKTWLTLGITGLGIVYILLPAFLKGYDPIIVTVLGSIIISCVTLGIVGGINKKTLTAIIGTTGGVLVAGLTAMLVGLAANLSGYGSEEAAMLSSMPYDVPFNLQRLLFAGMMIGALGAVMDVAMSVASSMEEVSLMQPEITPGQLLSSGLRVGRDVMGTMSNTLILAYTGGSIPLLLIFLAYKTPVIKIVSFDHIATEIVKALAGSIGLIAAIPITALAGSRLCPRGASDRGRLNQGIRSHSSKRG